MIFKKQFMITAYAARSRNSTEFSKNGTINWNIFSYLFILVLNSLRSGKWLRLGNVRKNVGSVTHLIFERYPDPSLKTIFMILFMQIFQNVHLSMVICNTDLKIRLPIEKLWAFATAPKSSLRENNN